MRLPGFRVNVFFCLLSLTRGQIDQSICVPVSNISGKGNKPSLVICDCYELFSNVGKRQDETSIKSIKIDYKLLSNTNRVNRYETIFISWSDNPMLSKNNAIQVQIVHFYLLFSAELEFVY